MRVFKSAYDIGDNVTMYRNGGEIEGRIDSVTFTDENIWYDIIVAATESYTVLHRVDPAMLEPEGRQ